MQKPWFDVEIPEGAEFCLELLLFNIVFHKICNVVGVAPGSPRGRHDRQLQGFKRSYFVPFDFKPHEYDGFSMLAFQAAVMKF